MEEDKNAHIPSSEILQDIRDTRSEIEKWTREADALEQMPMTSDHRLDHMRASARRNWIKEAEQFIKDLEEILRNRDKHAEQNSDTN